MSLRYVLLAVLSEEPNTGYGIGRLLHGELNHLWDARLQQIYGELAKLEAQEFITAEAIALPNRPAKKIYTLTQLGSEALDDWLEEPPAPVSPKNDLLVKLHCLHRIAPDVVVQRLEERRSLCVAKASGLRDRLSDLPASSAPLGHRLTIDAALNEAEAQATWCDRALTLMKRGLTPADVSRARFIA